MTIFRWPLLKPEPTPIRSGDSVTCKNCKYEGRAYGVPHSGGYGHNAGVSAPWCPRCGLNNQLVKV